MCLHLPAGKHPCALWHCPKCCGSRSDKYGHQGEAGPVSHPLSDSPHWAWQAQVSTEEPQLHKPGLGFPLVEPGCEERSLFRDSSRVWGVTSICRVASI